LGHSIKASFNFFAPRHPKQKLEFLILNQKNRSFRFALRGTMSRKTWQIRIETQMRLSCNRDVFLLQGNLRAREGANEICHRGWDRSIPRDLL
jgi:hypothetical protein